jgi:hypothetical protein
MPLQGIFSDDDVAIVIRDAIVPTSYALVTEPNANAAHASRANARNARKPVERRRSKRRIARG